MTANLKRHDVLPKIALQLFDAFVAPVLYYGCEVSGFTNANNIEKLHLRFCEKVLGVRQSTSNVAVYEELGRYPLYINRFVTVIRYWFKLGSSDNIILSNIVADAKRDSDVGIRNWFLRLNSY